MLPNIILFLTIVRPIVDMLVNVNISPSVNMGQLWGVLIIILSILYILQRGSLLMKSSLHIPLLILFLFFLVAFMSGEDKLLCLSILLKYISWSLSFVVLFDIFSRQEYFLLFERNLPRMGWTVVIIYFAVIAISYQLGGHVVSNMLGHNIYNYRQETLFKGPFPHAHAASFVSFCFVVFIFLRKRDYAWRISDALLVGGFAAIILLTMTRSGMLAALLFFLLTLRKNKLVVLACSVLLIYLTVSFVGGDVFGVRLFKEYDLISSGKRGYESLGSGRLGMWKAVLTFFSDQHALNMLFGSGLDADMVATKMYFYERGAHNDFLYLMVATGFLSLLLFIFILHLIMKLFWAIRDNTATIFNAFFWSALLFMMTQGLVQSLGMFYFMVIVAYSYYATQFDNTVEIPLAKGNDGDGMSAGYING